MKLIALHSVTVQGFGNVVIPLVALVFLTSAPFTFICEPWCLWRRLKPLLDRVLVKK